MVTEEFVLNPGAATRTGLGTVFKCRIIGISGISASGLKGFLCIQVRGRCIKLSAIRDSSCATGGSKYLIDLVRWLIPLISSHVWNEDRQLLRLMFSSINFIQFGFSLQENTLLPHFKDLFNDIKENTCHSLHESHETNRHALWVNCWDVWMLRRVIHVVVINERVESRWLVLW